MVIYGERWDGNIYFCKKHWHQWGFDGFWVTQPLPLTDFKPPDHCFQWIFDGFGVIQPSPFNDFQPPDHCFQWFSDFKHKWPTMVLENLHPKKCMIPFIFDEI